MASPFKVFRKHQKAMLAVLAILAMFGFVVLPIVLQSMGYQKQANPRVLSTAAYGDLEATDLYNLRRQRQIVLRFLGALREAVRLQGGDYRSLDRLIQNLGSVGEEDVVESWLLARRAEELGLVVDRHTINLFLTYLTQDRIGSRDVEGLLKNLGIRVNTMFAAMEQELLSLRLREMFRLSLSGATPAQRWGYFQRLHRKVTIQSVPVRVRDFVDEVEDPDEATLEAFFDRYKAEPYDPRSPEPGFREPQRIAVEYLKAEYEKFVDPTAVTAEEVEAHYEEKKDSLYRQVELPGLGSEGPKEPETPPESEIKKEQAEGPADSAGQPTSEGEAKGEPGEPKPPATPPGESSDSNANEPAETEASKTEAPDPASPESADSKETSLRKAASPFRPVSYLAEDADKNEPTDKKSAPAPGQEASDAEAPRAEEPPAEKTPGKPAERSAEKRAPSEGPASDGAQVEKAQAKAAPNEKSANDAAPSKKPVLPPAEGRDKPGPPAADSSQTDQKEPGGSEKPKYKPLEEVEAEIRNTLARQRANTKIRTLLNEIQVELKRYRQQLILKKAPVELDFRALAKEHGLIAYQPQKPKLMSVLEARETDIGKSWIGGRFRFTQYAYQQQRLPEERPAVSQPEISQDDAGNYYLYWKVDEVDERIPELDEPGVKKRVLGEWKMGKARSLAQKEAERLAAEARKAVESPMARARRKEEEAERLAEKASQAEEEASKDEADRLATEAREEAENSWGEAAEAFRQVVQQQSEAEVSESEPFAWMTTGAIPPWMAQVPPAISDEVEGVEMAGNDFMRAVFGLKQGEIGTAMNDPKTAAYVVRVVDSNPLPDVLWRMFLAENYFSYFRAAWPEHASAEKAWLNAVKQEVGFQWDPDWQRESWRRQGGYD